LWERNPSVPFILAVLALLGMGAISALHLHGTAQEVELLLADDARDLFSVQQLVVDSEHSARKARTFLLTGEERFFREEQEARKAIQRDLRELDVLIDSPNGRRLLGIIQRAQREAWVEVDKAFAARRAGNLQEAIQRVLQDVQPPRDELDRAFAVLVKHKQTRLAQHQERLTQGTRSSFVLFLGTLLLGMVMTGGFWAMAQRARRKEDEAYHSAEQLRLLIEGIKEYAVFLVDPRGVIASWNPGVERVKGYRAEEFIGQPFSMLFTPEERARGLPELEMKQAASEGKVEQEGTRLRKDGSRFEAEVVLRALRNEAGQLLGFVKVTRDISKRKRAEQNLRFLSEASATLTSSLEVQATLDVLAKLAVPHLADWCTVDLRDGKGHLRRVGAAHASASKVRCLFELDHSAAPLDPESSEGQGYVLRTGERELRAHVSEEDLRHLARDEVRLRLLREVGLASWLIVPLKRRGRTVGAITFARAEAGRPFLSEDVALVEELARRASLAVDNALLYRESQEAIRLRDGFLTVASHELKTPLTVFRLQMELLERGLNADSRQQVRGRLLTARQQVSRLHALVESLLDVSLLADGGLVLEPSPVDLGALVRETLRTLQEEFRRAGSEVTLETGSGVVGQWDAARLAQSIGHLLTNAARYGAGRPVHVRVEEEGGKARVRVRDEGIGIAPEHLEHIFERFGRAVSERNYGGLGLGLYLTRRLIEAMGGAVSVESRPGQGSLFTLELPLRPSAPEVVDGR
jgi:PAS domain S-box-containing protein